MIFLFFNPPQVIPLVLQPGDYGVGPGWGRTGVFVAARVGKRDAMLLVSPSSASSTLNPETATDAITAGAVGPFPVRFARSKPGASIVTGRPIDGLLGADFLKGKVLGFDPDGKTLTVWTGDVPEDDLKAWAGKDAVRSPLETLPDGRPIQAVNVAGGTLRLLLSAMPGAAWIGTAQSPPGATDAGIMPGTRGLPAKVLSGASAPGRTLGWLLHASVPSGEAIEGDGLLPLFEGTTGRLVLDAGRGFVLSRPAGEDGRMAEEMSRALRVTVVVRDGAAFLGSAGSVGEENLKPDFGKEIVALNDKSVRKLLAGLKNGDAKTVLRMFVRMWREGYGLGFPRSPGSEDIELTMIPGQG